MKKSMISGKLSLPILGIIILSFMFSCANRKQAGSDSANADSLLIRYQALRDSVDSNWAVMINDDDNKLFLMSRLLQEVSYTNNYDKAQFEKLNDLLEALREMRYDQQSMQKSSLIDDYDSATFAVSDQIILFARSHPRFSDIPIMAELIADINAKNNYILMHRIHYDNWVKDLNAFQKEHREELINASPESSYEDMPLFQLPM